VFIALCSLHAHSLALLCTDLNGNFVRSLCNSMPPAANSNGNTAPHDTSTFAYQLAAALTRIGLDDDVSDAVAEQSSKHSLAGGWNAPRASLVRDLEWVQGAMHQAGLTDPQREALTQLLTSLQPRHSLTPYLRDTYAELVSAQRTVSSSLELNEREEALSLKQLEDEEEDLEHIESVGAATHGQRTNCGAAGTYVRFVCMRAGVRSPS